MRPVTCPETTVTRNVQGGENDKPAQVCLVSEGLHYQTGRVWTRDRGSAKLSDRLPPWGPLEAGRRVCRGGKRKEQPPPRVTKGNCHLSHPQCNTGRRSSRPSRQKCSLPPRTQGSGCRHPVCGYAISQCVDHWNHGNGSAGRGPSNLRSNKGSARDGKAARSKTWITKAHHQTDSDEGSRTECRDTKGTFQALGDRHPTHSGISDATVWFTPHDRNAVDGAGNSSKTWRSMDRRSSKASASGAINTI